MVAHSGERASELTRGGGYELRARLVQVAQKPLAPRRQFAL